MSFEKNGRRHQSKYSKFALPLNSIKYEDAIDNFKLAFF